jgi:hypothetical protein
VAEPGAVEKVARRVEPLSVRRSPGTAPVGPDRNASPARLFRTSRGTRITCPAEHEASRTGGRAVLENVPPTLPAPLGTFSRGAPPGMASRRSAPQPPSRPSRRPEVAETERGRASPQATAGRRAGAEARRAPKATAGRCIEEPAPGALLPNEVLPNARGGCQAPLKRPRDSSGREATGGHLAPLPWAPIAMRHRCAHSRAPQGPRITSPPEHEESRTGGRAVLENVPPTLPAPLGTFSRGAPPGMASRRSAPQPPSRPSRRPEVAETERGRASPQATAGRRAGAQTRRAPNATAGRCIEETGPGALLPNEVLPNARGGCQAPLKRSRDASNR